MTCHHKAPEVGNANRLETTCQTDTLLVFVMIAGKWWIGGDRVLWEIIKEVPQQRPDHLLGERRVMRSPYRLAISSNLASTRTGVGF